MLTKLPIPGIELRKGEVFLDGEPWDNVPDSRRCTLSIDLGIARSSDGGVLIIDAVEKLDDDNFEVMLKHLQRCGRQCFVARATSNVKTFKLRTLPAIQADAAVTTKSKKKAKTV